MNIEVKNMLKRKIMEKLINWKNNKDKMCLILKGPRQVGKTYIVNKFAEENYKNYIYINFYEHPELSVIFDGSLNVDDILAQIKLLSTKILINK